eukprot:GHRR01034867.1.p2 GENE.GHRR01034867.1~~GHRR01034867.1.p2  ORF type:complete len:103 (+),score=13.68 GHRR01034867.1:391-699(+)
MPLLQHYYVTGSYYSCDLRRPKSYQANGLPSMNRLKPVGGFWPEVCFFHFGNLAHLFGLYQHGTSRQVVPITPHFVSAIFSKAQIDRSRWYMSPQHQRLLLW